MKKEKDALAAANAYHAAAAWCAHHGVAGRPGDPLPFGLSGKVWREINDEPAPFTRRRSERGVLEGCRRIAVAVGSSRSETAPTAARGGAEPGRCTAGKMPALPVGTLHIRSMVSMPSSPRPSRSVRAVRSHSRRRLRRVASSGASSTGQAS